MPAETFAWREEYIIYLEERVRILEEFKAETVTFADKGALEVNALRERLAFERQLNSDLRSELLKRKRTDWVWEIVKIGGAFAIGTQIK